MPKEITIANAKARFEHLLGTAGTADDASWNSAVVTCINRYLGASSSYAISAVKFLGGEETAAVIKTKLTAMLKSIVADLANNELNVASETGYFDAYAAFTVRLRVWLLTYGVGLVATMITTKELFELVVTGRTAWLVIGFVLLGILTQLVLMLLYKFAMWSLYEHEHGRMDESRMLYRVSKFLDKSVVVEFSADVITIASLLCASLILVFGITHRSDQVPTVPFWKQYDIGSKDVRLIDPKDYVEYLRSVRFPNGELNSLPTDAILLHDARPELFLSLLGYAPTEFSRIALGETDPNLLYVVRSKDRGVSFILNPGLPGAGGISTQVAELGALGVRRVVHVGTCGVLGSVPALDTLLISTGAYFDGAAAMLADGEGEVTSPDRTFSHSLAKACDRMGVDVNRCVGFTVPVFYSQPAAYMRMIATTDKMPKPAYVEMEGAPFFLMAKRMNMQAASLLAGTDRYVPTETGIEHSFIEYDMDSLKLNAMKVAIEVFKQPRH